MLLYFILSLLWNIYSDYAYRHEIIRQCLEAVPLSIYDLDNLKPQEHKLTLAPPPIRLNTKFPIPNRTKEEVIDVPIQGRKIRISYNPRRRTLRLGKEPDYPYIIRGPNENYWIKVHKGGSWVSLKAIEDHLNFLRSFVNQAMYGGKPPPPPSKGGNGNGGGNDEFHPPFKVGDNVKAREKPELGIGKVLKVEYLKPAGGRPFWGITAQFHYDGSFTTYSHEASHFEKVDL